MTKPKPRFAFDEKGRMVDLKPFQDAQEERVRDAKFREELRQGKLKAEERIQKALNDSLMSKYGGQDKLIEWGALLIVFGIISWAAVPDHSFWGSLLFVLAILLWICGGLIVLVALIKP